MHLKMASRFFFAATMIAMGVIGLMSGRFAPIWQPVPDTLPGHLALADLCTFVSLAAGGGLLVKRTAALAALVLLVYLMIWTVLFKVPFIIRAPLVEVSYQSCGENVVQIAGVWCLYIWLANETGRAQLGFLAGDGALRLARLLCGLAFIAFGFSHFAYLNMTAPLVPKWLPAPVLWAYLTGTAYLATGVSLVTGVAARLGALIAAAQITLITLVVWGPSIVAGSMSAGNMQETVVSWAITAGAWLVAASFDGEPWFAFVPLRRQLTAAS